MNYDKAMGMSNRDIHIKQNSGGYELSIKVLREMVANAIAEAFHYMHIIEAWGTGIPRIINRCKEYGLKEPVFEEFGDGFRVTIFRKDSGKNGKAVDSHNKKATIKSNDKNTGKHENSIGIYGVRERICVK